MFKTVFENVYHLAWNFRKKFKNNFNTNNRQNKKRFWVFVNFSGLAVKGQISMKQKNCNFQFFENKVFF